MNEMESYGSMAGGSGSYCSLWEWTWTGCSRPLIEQWAAITGISKIVKFVEAPISLQLSGGGCRAVIPEDQCCFVVVDATANPGNSVIIAQPGGYRFAVPARYGQYSMPNVLLYAILKSQGLNPKTPETYGNNTSGYLAHLKSTWNMINGWPKF